MTSYTLLPDMCAEIERLNREAAGLRGALHELRSRLHSQGRRPQECYEMSLIDDALKPLDGAAGDVRG